MRRQNWFCTKHLLWFNPHTVCCASRVAVTGPSENGPKWSSSEGGPVAAVDHHHTVWQLRQESGYTCRDQETHSCPRAVLFKKLIYGIASVQLGSGSGEEQKPITTKNTRWVFKNGAGQSANQTKSYQALFAYHHQRAQAQGFSSPWKMRIYTLACIWHQLGFGLLCPLQAKDHRISPDQKGFCFLE